MGDKKFFPGFGYDRTHRIGPRRRRRLTEAFGLQFTEEDFSDMAHAVDACRGAYEALQSAPSPKEMLRQFDRIRDAAHDLRTLLHPEMIQLQADAQRAPQELTPAQYSVAKEAADRVMHDIRFGTSLPLDLSDARQADRLADVGAFVEILGQVPLFTESLRQQLLCEVDAEGPSWMVVSERGKGHLVYLLRDLEGIALRHGKPTRYTRPVYGDDDDDEAPYSFVAKLAFHLGPMLPKAARPKSEGALIAMLARQPVKDAA